MKLDELRNQLRASRVELAPESNDIAIYTVSMIGKTTNDPWEEFSLVDFVIRMELDIPASAIVFGSEMREFNQRILGTGLKHQPHTPIHEHIGDRDLRMTIAGIARDVAKLQLEHKMVKEPYELMKTFEMYGDRSILPTWKEVARSEVALGVAFSVRRVGAVADGVDSSWKKLHP